MTTETQTREKVRAPATRSAASSHDVAGAAAPGRAMPALTMMRAFLAWWVVAFHLAPLYPFDFDQQGPWLRSGVIRVDCFFVISGFVLFNAYPVLLNRADPTALRDFFVARFARVYPLHLVMLCAFVLLVLGAHLAGIHLNNEAAFTARTLVNQILLLNGSFCPDGGSWNYPSWSVGAEAIAYIAAPVLFLSVSRLSDRAALSAMLVCGIVVVGLTETRTLSQPGMIPCRVLLEFGLGALMCRVVRKFHEPMLKIRRAALLLGLTAAVGFAFLRGHGPFFAAMLWMIGFLSLGRDRHNGLPGWIEAGLLYLGRTAFAVYICHAFVLTIWAGAVARLDPGYFGHKLPAAIMLCLVIQMLATSLHHLVEVPARRAIRRILQDTRGHRIALAHPRSSPPDTTNGEPVPVF